MYCRAWSQRGSWASNPSADVELLYMHTQIWEWVSETESLAAPLSFCGISVDARSCVSFSSGPDLCQEPEGVSQGPINQSAGQTVAPGLWRGSTYAYYPGQKGRLSSPVTLNDVESTTCPKSNIMNTIFCNSRGNNRPPSLSVSCQRSICSITIKSRQMPLIIWSQS